MTTRQLNALTAYVLRVRNWMNLHAWQIDVVDQDPPDREARAQVETTDGRYHAALWVDAAFLESSPEEQRNSIVHELLHVVAREQNDVVRAGGLPDALGQPAFDLLWKLYKQHHERVTDHLSSILAPYAPLPRIPKR